MIQIKQLYLLTALIATLVFPTTWVRAEANLSDGQVYTHIIAGEMAINSADWAQAYAHFLAATQATGDPTLAHRTTQIAVTLEDFEKATVAGELWANAAPDNALAQETAAKLFFNLSDNEKTYHYLSRLIVLSDSQPEVSIATMGYELKNPDDHKMLYRLTERLVIEKTDNPSAHLALAHLATQRQDFSQAVTSIDKALSIRPKYTAAAILKSEVLLIQKKTDEALKFLGEYYAHHKERDLTLYFAELLMENNQDKQAIGILKPLLNTASDKDIAHIYLAQAHMNLKQNGHAETHLKSVIDVPLYADTARYYLGHLAEKRDDAREAVRWYTSVQQGEFRVTARILAANLVAKGGDIEGGAGILRFTEAETIAELKQLSLAEAEIYYTADQNKRALEIVGAAINRIPNDSDLYYAHGVLADRLGLFSSTEESLKLAIKHDPNHADALNALGYAITNNSKRFDEARAYIERALAIQPENPAFLDSLGWTLFHMKSYEEAKILLHRAFAKMPDPEIAAHLGEVLWVMGEKAEATKIWMEAYGRNPNHAILKSTMARYEFSPTERAGTQIGQ